MKLLLGYGLELDGLAIFAAKYLEMIMILRFLMATSIVLLSVFEMHAQQKAARDEPLKSSLFSKLAFRSIGPALTSGRISDLAVNPNNPSEYYAAAASGGVWKTVNKGLTWQPVFDDQGAYSIGCIAIDPSNTNTVWVGTGENNNQRSVAYGDGVYRSDDGGKSWKNMGLKTSEHIGKIIVHPTNSNIVYVAAYGPVWSEGGERGVYKTIDGGHTWTCVKSVSPYTGCNEIAMDPTNPEVIYAAFHQRMRKVYTYIGGGPESALYKSTDGGATWKKLQSGLPTGDIGRIGIGISPVNPNVIYAVVETADDKGGVFRSTDQGASWEKRSGYFTSGNYYQEIFCDPKDVNKIFITDTYFKYSVDGGKTMLNLGETNKHIDNHAIWIDPHNTDHLIVGCDGGIYETYDFAKTWDFKANLPITQFYKVSVDNARPFYNVHGGTQDNFSLAGPSRTTSGHGITNADWFVTSIGDGFETQVDPVDPSIVYAQAQYGALSRYDHKSGEILYIQPQPRIGEAPYRWNWDAPLLISQHKNTRLYFGANKLFRSEDRGNSWEIISPDLSRQVDRNKLEVMGKVWSVNAVAKNKSTDIFGQVTSMAESAFDENLLWAGTDDGLIHVTTDGGKNWRMMDNIPGVPQMSYVNQIIASLHDKNTAYVCFNHHRYGDFKPYVFKTTDFGKTWKAIHNNLPTRGSVYTIAEDHVDPKLLFVGTEFGCFFSNDGGQHWVQLKAGLPTIAIRDIEIQRRENDLVLASFGRGFYILDDYSPLRHFKADSTSAAAILFPIRPALIYTERLPYGLRDKAHLGSGFYAAPNPKPGAVFTYYIRDEVKSYKDKRLQMEKAMDEKKQKYFYPSLDSLRKEREEQPAYLLFTIRDDQDQIIRHLKADYAPGVQRISWDFRYNNQAPTHLRPIPSADELFASAETGFLCAPGRYSVELYGVVDGVPRLLVGKTYFDCKLLEQHSLPVDMAENVAFNKKVADLRRAVSSLTEISNAHNARIAQAKKALEDMYAPHDHVWPLIKEISALIRNNDLTLKGDDLLAFMEIEAPLSLNARVGMLLHGLFDVTCQVPQSYKQLYGDAVQQYKACYAELKKIEQKLSELDGLLNFHKAPYTPGRWPSLDIE